MCGGAVGVGDGHDDGGDGALTMEGRIPVSRTVMGSGEIDTTTQRLLLWEAQLKERSWVGGRGWRWAVAGRCGGCIEQDTRWEGWG